MERAKTLESRVRRLAQRNGYRVHKSRQREHINNQGEFMLIENDRNLCILGRDYDATLDDIKDWLRGEPAEEHADQ